MTTTTTTTTDRVSFPQWVVSIVVAAALGIVGTGLMAMVSLRDTAILLDARVKVLESSAQAMTSVAADIASMRSTMAHLAEDVRRMRDEKGSR